MKHPVFAVVCALLLLGSPTTFAQPDLEQRSWTYGRGSQPCGSWTAERKISSPAWYQQVHWVLGWLSAANAYARVTPRRTDADAIYTFLDIYCAGNPLKDISDAARALAVELGTRR
jgi:hypothetical protein